MKKTKQKPEKTSRGKRVFRLFDKLAVGLIKVWLHGSPYIVAIDDVDDFIKSEIEKMK
jgi:hypothetical protein